MKHEKYEIAQLESEGQGKNFIYVIWDVASRQAAIIDPGYDAAKALDFCEQERITPIYTINTHRHDDHCLGNKDVAAAAKTRLIAHYHDSDSISRTGGVPVDYPVGDEDEIQLGEKTKIVVLHTPGHTLGSICLQVDRDLVTGDTLVVGNIGRTNFNDGDPQMMWDSLQRLKKLDPLTRIWPGHDYGPAKTSTIGEQLKINRYLKARNFEGFKRLREKW